jgi:IclR family acetate operon transcriptional repressor
MNEQPTAAESQYAIRSVTRVLDIIDLLRLQPAGATLAEIATAAAVPKTTAYRYVAALQARNYVERDETSGRYRLSLALLMQAPFQSLGLRVRPYLEEIRDRFGETANLGILDGARVLYVEILESEKTMRLAARKGDRDPIHSTALGKAIAAQLPDTTVRRILVSEGMPRLTAETLVDPDDYLGELRLVRKRGWALDNGENEDGGRCLAVTLDGVGLPAAISLSAPAVRFRLEDVEPTAAALLSVTARLRRDLVANVT